MNFEEAVQNTPGLERAYRPGLQAIRSVDHDLVSCRNPRALTGSVDLDDALAASLPNDPRWDYGVGVKPRRNREKLIWIEVHPASSHHVDPVLRKLHWLKNWLQTHAPKLDAFPREFVWIPSGRVSLQPNSPQRRKVASKGLRFTSRLPLD